MTQLYLNHITKLIAGQPLFTTDQLTAQTGDRVGIVGANGAGKTTLAKIITGTDRDFTGQRQLNAPVVRVPQIAPTQGQSGGQSMLARVRQALAQRPEILILDEPSANLDDRHQAWLSQALGHFDGLLLLISHDRDLLQRVATKLWVVDQGCFTQYNGTFAAYQTAKQQRDANEMTQYQNQQNDRRKLQLAAQKKREKAHRVRKGNRKMSAAERSNSRTLREQNAGRLERNAHDLAERAAQQVTTTKPHTTAGIKLVATDLPPVTGKYLVNVTDLTLKRGKHQLLTRASLRIRPGERVALTGPNGSGKSTLLDALLAHHAQTHLAASARIGYFYQDMTALPADQTVWQVMSRATTLDADRTRQVMGAFGLDAKFYDRLVGDLSGGEQVKLQLLSILVSASNLLLLDEPTNYLDLPALQALADYLVGYPGTVLFVAHDQTFRQQVATRTVQLTDHQLVDPQRTAQGVPASDLPRLRFEYDRLMLDPTADTAKIRALREKIAVIQRENG
ncbi:ABC-F family ATP-binding cassette domain-containing protein [Levilactobacillus acidifarinae]|uniref:ABC transporter ATPase n=1 Tax=Levilactobacillus acidifarinae DSM 19394 = JCM 15949 TaxID=1423715 RepID=A0A0R1LFK8_9LACO|nr:ATP-binding cassette domain-containing protein [Levilactobacillus acidifarinae]KRK94168.1 ABC transporter ATPase [Levilactobacillus acidifarinae DSM 19394]GEO70164.1 ABC transporter ATP-binding protein [Levilactobacillus acidifarinae]